MKLNGLNNKEWQIITSLAELEPKQGHFIGDDCAILDKNQYLVTTDQMAEFHHFDFSFMPHKSVGWRLMAANASDIISMGSTPEIFFLNIAIPKERFNEAEKIIDGIKDFAKKYEISIAGGDTTGANTFFLAVTMLGKASDKVWERKNAKPGDKIFIADYPGLSKTGFIALKKKYSGFEESKKRFLTPNPYLFPIKNKALVNAAIDISDSIVTEMLLIAKMSKVTIEIELSKIPIHPEVKEMAEKENISVDEIILSSGEEFFLIVSSPENIPNYFEIGRVNHFNGEQHLVITKNFNIFDYNSINLYSHFGS